MEPTAEQEVARDLFATGESLVVEAGAGAGKTSTLLMLANDWTGIAGQYVAFNRLIVNEAKRKMPPWCPASTAHQLAMAAVGQPYRHRLNSDRMRSSEIAHRLGVRPITVSVGQQTKALSDAYLAGLVMRTVVSFCQSADRAPRAKHVPYIDGIDMPTPTGRGVTNNRIVAEHIMGWVDRAWRDLRDPEGSLPFRHDHYLKMWELGAPHIGARFILFDEAQDVNPVLASIVAQQEHAQLVYVGDSNQSIYEWMGAVNALENLDAAFRAMLTRSFRFGPTLANLANLVLWQLGADMRLTGAGPATTIGPVDRPDAILCRTNATAVSTTIKRLAAGERVHLTGGTAQVLSFTDAAEQLMAGQRTTHPELACFESWAEVQAYVGEDAQGVELKLLVDLIDEFGTDVIRKALESTVRSEDNADIVVSTAHKAKGREWGAVQLAGDFVAGWDDSDIDDAELRLLYVAVTRARTALDPTAVPFLADLLAPVGA